MSEQTKEDLKDLGRSAGRAALSGVRHGLVGLATLAGAVKAVAKCAAADATAKSAAKTGDAYGIETKPEPMLTGATLGKVVRATGRMLASEGLEAADEISTVLADAKTPAASLVRQAREAVGGVTAATATKVAGLAQMDRQALAEKGKEGLGKLASATAPVLENLAGKLRRAGQAEVQELEPKQPQALPMGPSTDETPKL
jgi:hypothetical protein